MTRETQAGKISMLPLDGEKPAERPAIDEAVMALSRLLESNKHVQDHAGRVIGSLASEMSAVSKDQASALSELRTRIDRVETLADNGGQVVAFTAAVHELGRQVSATHEDSARLGLTIQEQLSMLVERVIHQEKPVMDAAVFEAPLTRLAERVGETESRLATYPKIEKSVAVLNIQIADLERIETLVGALDRGLSDVRQETGQFAASIVARVDATEGRVAHYRDIEQSIVALNARIQGLEQVEGLVTGLVRELGEIRGETSRFAEGLTARVNAAESAGAQIPRLEESFVALNARVVGLERIEAAVASLDREFSAARSETAALCSGLADRMAAAESTVAKIHEIEPTLVNLNARVMGLEKIEAVVVALDGDLAAVREEARGLSAGLAAQGGTVESLAARFPGVDGALAALNARFAGFETIKPDFADLQRDVAAAREETRVLSAGFAERLGAAEAVIGNFAQVEQSAAGLHARIAGLDKIEAAIVVLDRNLAAARGEARQYGAGLTTRIGAAEARFANYAALEKSVAGLSARGAGDERIEKSLAALTRDLAAAREDTGRLGARVAERFGVTEAAMANNTKFEDAIAALNGRVVGLERLEAAVATLDRNLTIARTEWNRGAEAQDAAAERVAAIEGRLRDDGARENRALSSKLTALATRIEQNEREANARTSTTDIRVAVAGLESRLSSSVQDNRDVLLALQASLDQVNNRLQAIEERAAAAPAPTQVEVTLAAPQPSADVPDKSGFHAVPSHDYPVEAAEEAEPSVPDEPPAPVPNYLANARRAARSSGDKAPSQDESRNESAVPPLFSAGGRKLLVAGAAAVLLLLAVTAAGFFLAPQWLGTREAAPSVAAIPQPAPGAAIPSAQVAPIDKITADAKAGDARSMHLLSIAYAEGAGVAKDDAQSILWLQKAAEAGAPVAQYRLGTRYELGLGVPKDVGQAVRWYGEAAKQGNRNAMHNLAVAYANGLGTEKNPAEAAHWFTAAAELGMVNAQFNLGALYEEGFGVAKSQTEAYKWFAIAGAGGDMEAKTRAAAIAKTLPAVSKPAVEMAIASFVPKPMDLKANQIPTLLPATP